MDVLSLLNQGEHSHAAVSSTWSSLALPPTSKKFAGEPPCIEMISIVAIAKPVNKIPQPVLLINRVSAQRDSVVYLLFNFKVKNKIGGIYITGLIIFRTNSLVMNIFVFLGGSGTRDEAIIISRKEIITCTVHHAANVPVKADIVQVSLFCLNFPRIFLRWIPQSKQICTTWRTHIYI